MVVRNASVVDDDFVVHFPVPMRHAWGNVLYTCQVMLLFRDRGQVEDWCARHAVPLGDVRPVRTVNTFAREWYGSHLDANWRTWTPREARDMCERHGLTGDIWRLESAGARF